MGFLPDIREIFAHLPRTEKHEERTKKLKVFLLSATIIPGIEGLMKRFAPKHELINLNDKLQVAQTVRHVQYHVSSVQKKFRLLLFLLRRKESLEGKQVLVFVRTKQKADRIAEKLKRWCNIAAESIHKDKSPTKRTELINKFMNKELRVLIATDVLARGIDVPDLQVVVNYDIPALPEDYIHRVGRTGRAGNEGTAFSFVSNEPQVVKLGKSPVEMNDMHYVAAIEKFLGHNIERQEIPGTWRDNKGIGDEDADIEMDEHVVRPNSKGQQKTTERNIVTTNTQKKIKEDTISTSKRLAFELLERKKEAEQKRIEHLKSHNKIRGPVSERISNIYRELKSKIVEEGNLRNVKHAPTLRHFKEGRYEEMITKFEERRATRRGVNVDNIKKDIKQRRKLMKKKLDAEKKMQKR
mgnify:CR=1 FL=1